MKHAPLHWIWIIGLASLTVGADCSALSDAEDDERGRKSNAGGAPSGSDATPPGPANGAGGGFFGGGGEGSWGGEDPRSCEEAKLAKSYVGCDFWPTVVANSVWSIFDFAVVVANAGDQVADVTVERKGNVVQTVQIPPNELRKLYVPWVSELKGKDFDPCGVAIPFDETVRAEGGAYHLTSNTPVAVYQFNALEYRGDGGPDGKSWAGCPGNDVCQAIGQSVGCYSFSNDASLLLPSTTLTGNYRLTSQAGWPSPKVGAYVAITGTQDGTQVSVTVSPTGELLAGGGVQATKANGKTTFTLDAGDVVELASPATADLSGTLIQADKPVQAITGVPCIQAPIGTQACDHIEESVLPAETLGKRYLVTVPTGPNGSAIGHVVRLYGNVDGTTLEYPGGAPKGAPTSLSAGQVADLGVVDTDFEVSANHEFAVASFMLGASLVDPGKKAPEQRGDPSQSVIIATEQFRKKYVFLTPDDYDVSFVDVIQPMGAAVSVDGAKSSVQPTPIGSSGYGVARIPLGPGNAGAHLLSADVPVGIQVMGYGAYTSYQYPGGLNLAAIAPPPPQ